MRKLSHQQSHKKHLKSNIKTKTYCGHQAVDVTRADKIDIDGAEGGAPVFETRESKYEDIYMLKVELRF
jgi:hypothetical protein